MIRVGDPLAHADALLERVYAYVAYRIGDGPEAEDVTSDVFERAIRYRSSFDRTKGEPVAWLIGVARRCIEGRPGLRDPVVGEVRERADSIDVEGDALRRITLASAIARLDRRDRELIALRYGADLTARQIATIVGLEMNAIEVALHRALGRLRGHLEREGLGAAEQALPAGRTRGDMPGLPSP